MNISQKQKPSRTTGFHSITSFRVAGGTLLLLFLMAGAAYAAPPLTIKITAPQDNARVTNSTLIVRGTARSNTTNDPLSAVRVRVNDAEAVTAEGLENWQAAVELIPGTNFIRAASVGESGAESAEALRTVTLVTFAALTIETNGSGRVQPNVNGRTFAVGSTQRLRAVPAPDFLFSEWTGATNSTNAVLDFLVVDGTPLIANFVPDPFAACRGIYQGLIMDAATPTHQSSGFFQVQVTNRTRYQGKFIVGGKNYTRNGQFDENGFSEFTLPAGTNGGPALAGTLQLDLTNATDQITGTISDGTFTSTLLGDRAVCNVRTNVSPYAGRYNLNFLKTETVQGNGYGVVTVDGNGVLRLTGQLADGKTINQSARVSKNGKWPLYVTTFGGQGSVVGWMTFENLPNSSVTGDPMWFRPARANTPYPEGFSITLPTIGSLFITPPAGEPMINWTTGIAELTGGGLPAPLVSYITWRTNNAIRVDVQMNNLVLNVNPQGVVRGNFTHPVSRRSDVLQGVVLPKTNWAGGFFVETNQSGLLFIGQDLSAGTNTFSTPPASLDGLTISLQPTRSTATFNRVPADISFAGGTFTTGSPEFTGPFNFSSGAAANPNVAELNLSGGLVDGRPTVVRMLLNFTSDYAGTYLATIPAGGSGVSSGAFTLGTTPTPPPPPPEE